MVADRRPLGEIIAAIERALARDREIGFLLLVIVLTLTKHEAKHRLRRAVRTIAENEPAAGGLHAPQDVETDLHVAREALSVLE